MHRHPDGSGNQDLARDGSRVGALDPDGADLRAHAGRQRRDECSNSTLTPYLPERSKATGTGVIIAPGGAFVALTVGLEGREVAEWLRARGIAAFLLKYRTVEKLQEGIPEMDMDTAGRYGIADGIQALKVVRRHAAEWGVSRIGSDFWVSPPEQWWRVGRCCKPTRRAGPTSPPLSMADLSASCRRSQPV